MPGFDFVDLTYYTGINRHGVFRFFPAFADNPYTPGGLVEFVLGHSVSEKPVDPDEQ
jgi:hypothetical protein